MSNDEAAKLIAGLRALAHGMLVDADPQDVADDAADLIEAQQQRITDLERAVEKVLELHKPETRYSPAGWDEYSFLTVGAARDWGVDTEVKTFTVCAHCGRIETDDDYREYRESMWPCATYKALQDAIGGE